MPSHSDRKARHTVFCVTGFSAPFCFGAHTPGKGGMYREPDRFHSPCVPAAVSGGVHYTGGSRRVFAAAAVAALRGASAAAWASCWRQCVGLLLPAIQRGQTLPLPAWIPSAVGLVLGAVGLFGWNDLRAALLAGGSRARRTYGAGCNIAQPPARGVWWRSLAAALALTGSRVLHQRFTSAEPWHRPQNIRKVQQSACRWPCMHAVRRFCGSGFRAGRAVRGHCLPLLWPRWVSAAHGTSAPHGAIVVREMIRRPRRATSSRQKNAADDDGIGCGIEEKQCRCVNRIKASAEREKRRECIVRF